jgi:hypothetical protein
MEKIGFAYFSELENFIDPTEAIQSERPDRFFILTKKPCKKLERHFIDTSKVSMKEVYNQNRNLKFIPIRMKEGY